MLKRLILFSTLQTPQTLREQSIIIKFYYKRYINQSINLQKKKTIKNETR